MLAGRRDAVYQRERWPLSPEGGWIRTARWAIRCAVGIVVVLLTVLAVGTSPGRAQPDSVRTEILKEKGFPPSHSPKGALWRTAAVPGWGQYYNRQYYKIPFVYAGLAGLAIRIYRSQQQYVLFDRAHLYGVGREMEGENPHSEYESQFEEVKQEVFLGRDVRLSEVRNQRDELRRQRDLAILGMGLFYTLTLLDAYVSAHLLTFDVSDDLAVRMHPTGNLATILSTRAGLSESTQQFISGGEASTKGIGMRIEVQF